MSVRDSLFAVLDRIDFDFWNDIIVADVQACQRLAFNDIRVFLVSEQCDDDSFHILNACVIDNMNRNIRILFAETECDRMFLASKVEIRIEICRRGYIQTETNGQFGIDHITMEFEISVLCPLDSMLNTIECNLGRNIIFVNDNACRLFRLLNVVFAFVDVGC